MFNYTELIKRLEESAFSQATKGDQSFMKKTSRSVKSDIPGMKPQGKHLDTLKVIRPASKIQMHAELMNALHPKNHGPVKAFAKGDLDWSELSDELQKTLYDYWMDHGMPYGIAKARTGDPDQWIADQMHALFEERRTRTRMQSIVHEAKAAAQEKELDEVNDYFKRRQRERDVDAGKPVKPLPKNPQNDYFARRKKEKANEEVETQVDSVAKPELKKQDAMPEKDDKTDDKTDKKTDKKKEGKESTGKKDAFDANPTMTPLGFRGVLPL